VLPSSPSSPLYSLSRLLPSSPPPLSPSRTPLSRAPFTLAHPPPPLPPHPRPQATSHEEIKQLLAKAQVIDELEATLPPWVERLVLRNCFPQYVHVLRVSVARGEGELVQQERTRGVCVCGRRALTRCCPQYAARAAGEVKGRRTWLGESRGDWAK
jgi:hypothetical protein